MGAAAGFGALIGAGTGQLKAQEEQAKAREQAQLQAARTEVAPLFSIQTGQSVQPGVIGEQPSEFDRIIQGAAAGAQFGVDNQSMFGGGGAAPPGGATAQGTALTGPDAQRPPGSQQQGTLGIAPGGSLFG